MALAPTGNADSPVELLATNEETVGRLYATYAERFPESQDFWQRLAAAERAHAKWIRKFNEDDSVGRMLSNPDRFRSAAIRMSIRHTEGEISSARSANLKPVNALSIANAIERSLIEARFFEVFEADSSELKRLLQQLRDETREHVQSVLERWIAERLSSAEPQRPVTQNLY